MVKRALIWALGIAFGTALGGVVIPRLIFSNLYSEAHPPIIIHALLYFVVGYIFAFLVILLTQSMKNK